MPYLEIVKENISEDNIKKEVEVPNIIGMNVKDAKKELKNLGLELNIDINNEDSNKKEIIIKNQLPTKGIKVYEGTAIFGYY